MKLISGMKPPLLRESNEPYTQEVKILEVVWKGLKEGWIKINFDGASHGNPSLRGVGCIARDVQGKILAKKSIPLGLCMNNEEEFWAATIGLQMGLELGVNRIHLRGTLS